MALQIGNLPPVPLITDQPETFDVKAVTFNLALDPWADQANALAAEAEGNATLADNRATDAETAQQAAELAQDLSEDARDLSQQYRNESEGFKDSSETAAAAAQSAAGLPSLVGNALKVLTVKPDESGVDWEPGVQSLYTDFTASGVFTPDPRARWVYVECIGGGASGVAKVHETNSSTWSTAAGGEGGHYAAKILRASDLPASVSVVVGAGGGAVTQNDRGFTEGNPGGSSFFGDFVEAVGGIVVDSHSGGGREDVSPATGGKAGGFGGQGKRGHGGGGGGAGALAADRRPGAPSLLSHGDGGDGVYVEFSASATANNGTASGGGGGGCKLLIETASTLGSSTSGSGGDGAVRVWQW